MKIVLKDLKFLMDDEMNIKWGVKMYKDNSNEEKQVFDVLAVPGAMTFVVEPEKSKEFENLKPNYELREKNRSFLERATNIKVELNSQEKILRKIK